MKILLTRPADAPRQTLAEYEAEGGYAALRKALSSMAPALVTAEVAAAGLRGRGGAAFPAARKWELAAGRAAERRYVVANGGEHEPGSRKDRHLLERYPHKVLEGMLLCGFATGASEGWLYLVEDMAEARAATEEALREMEAAALLGRRILGSPFSFRAHLFTAPTTYVAGEETAALRAIEGGPAKPRSKPPYPGESGLHGLPTTVNNVETLAHVPAILREGAAWYRALGTEDSTGTMLFTLGDDVERPGVYELPFGATFRDLIHGCGGGPRDGRPIRAFQPAFSCAFVSAEHVDRRVDHATLHAVGSSLGCGGLSLLLEGDDLLARLAAIADFFQDEQCGQCPPCRMETSHFVALLKALRRGEPGDHAAKIHKIASFTAGKGKCALIEMAAAPLLSALRLFPDEITTR